MPSYITFQNKKIHYQTHGSGNMVVFIHGFGEDASIWDLQVAYLKQFFQIIVPDIPGSGQSELMDNADIETYADIFYQIIIAEHSKKQSTPAVNYCTVIGHSMGGYITLALAEKYPFILNGYGLFHSSAYADNAEKIETRKKAIAFIQQYGAATFLETSIPGLFFQPETSHWPGLLIKKGKNFTTEALTQYYTAMINRPDRTPILKQSAVPVLFIIGRHDKAVPFDISLQQCHLPPLSHVHILQYSAHMGMLEETELSNEYLLAFLQNCGER